MVNDEYRPFARQSDIVQTLHPGLMENPKIPLEQRSEKRLRQQANNPQRYGEIRDGGDLQHARRRQSGGGGCRDESRAQHHHDRIDDVVRRDRAGAAGWLRLFLHDGIQRHRIQTAAHRQQQQIGQHAPTGQGLQHGHDGRKIVGTQHRGAEIPGEKRDAKGGERHVAGADLTAQQVGAQHGPDADADGEHGQQQSNDMAIGSQGIPSDGGEFRE